MSRGCLAIMASSKARPQVGQDVVVVVVVGDAENEFPPQIINLLCGSVVKVSSCGTYSLGFDSSFSH